MRGDLVRYGSIGALREDGVITTCAGVVRLEPFLNASLLTWVEGAAPGAALWVRLDPYFSANERPLLVLFEAVLLPANPKWWQKLTLHKGAKDGGQYALQPPANPNDDLEAFWDYRVRHVRRLEVHAVRRKENYLAMMVEELVDTRAEDGLLIGRGVHWDTAATPGTDVQDATTDHLDLAINIYSGDAANQRMAENPGWAAAPDGTPLYSHL